MFSPARTAEPVINASPAGQLHAQAPGRHRLQSRSRMTGKGLLLLRETPAGRELRTGQEPPALVPQTQEPAALFGGHGRGFAISVGDRIDSGRAAAGNDPAGDGKCGRNAPLFGEELQRRKTTISRDDMELEIFSRHNDQALYTSGRLDFRGKGHDAPRADLAAATRA
jgi:hypothetical protein